MTARTDGPETPAHPNIVLLFNDHQSYYGHGIERDAPLPQRPHFERLAKEGARFQRSYTACPLCGPARRTILTGVYPHAHKEIRNDVRHPFERETYLEVLARAGYRNFYFGKWHAGPGTAHDHQCTGFSYPKYGNPYKTPEYADYLARRGLPPFEVRIDHQLFACPFKVLAGYHQGKPYRPKRIGHSGWAAGTMTTPTDTHEAFFLANLACEQLERIAAAGAGEAGQPFHLRVDFWGPHQPYFVAREFLDLYDPETIPEHPSFRDTLVDKPKIYKKHDWMAKRHLVYPHAAPWATWQEIVAYHYAHISMIDAAGGRVLAALDRLGLADNTLVIWTTDHGDALGSHGGHFDKDCYLTEEVVRVPLAVRFPGRVPPGQTRGELVSNIDLPVTMLDAAGTRFPVPVHGRSYLPLCAGSGGGGRLAAGHAGAAGDGENAGDGKDAGNAGAWREDLMIQTHGHMHNHLGRAVVTGRFKYVYNEGDQDELYDLEADPYEMTNLIDEAEHADDLQHMRARLARWRDRTGDEVRKKHIKYLRNKLKM